MSASTPLISPAVASPSTRRTSAGGAPAVAGITMTAVVLVLIAAHFAFEALVVSDRVRPGLRTVLAEDLATTLPLIAAAVVGAVIFVRQPHNRVGWLALAAALLGTLKAWGVNPGEWDDALRHRASVAPRHPEGELSASRNSRWSCRCCPTRTRRLTLAPPNSRTSSTVNATPALVGNLSPNDGHLDASSPSTCSPFARITTPRRGSPGSRAPHRHIPLPRPSRGSPSPP
jgi:hypothetical protein